MQKKIPMRQCLGCREMKPKGELIRVVRSPEGEISLDAKGKAPGEKVTVTLPFKSGTDDDQIHAYAVSVRDDRGYIIETQRVLADFYKVKRPDQMKEQWSFTLTAEYIKGETYEIMLVACDDWGVASNIVTYTYQP